MARVEISGAWEGEVAGAVEAFFEDRLGPDIARDAARYCPERTGALKDSIEHHLEDGDLIVSATGGDGGRVYAAYLCGARSPRLSPVDWNHGTRGRTTFSIFASSAIPRTRRIALKGPGIAIRYSQ